MLKKFSLKNYKNFKDNIELDFEKIGGYQFSTDCIYNSKLSKMIIYGRNATGKTNLGKAIMNINETIYRSFLRRDDSAFLNADSNQSEACFSYTFDFDGIDINYAYTKNSFQELINEKLMIDETLVFQCNFETNTFDFNLEYIDADTAVTERYMQSLNDEGNLEESNHVQLPFLRWLLSNVAFTSESIMLKLSNYIRRMSMINFGNNVRHPYFKSSIFYDSLEDSNKLKDLEDFLNAMGIKCTLELKVLPDQSKELYFEHDKLVPFFDNASSGTLALFHLYQRVISQVKSASFVYLDEFDAFYHYEMAKNVIMYFKQKYPKCQMIMTTHNTNLMTNRLFRPDCLFILSRTGKLTALCNATPRELRRGHNLEKMYISGEFAAYE